jgi:hypothetical protein
MIHVHNQEDRYLICEKNIQDYNFACSSIWLRNFVLDIKGVFENRVLRRIFDRRGIE